MYVQGVSPPLFVVKYGSNMFDKEVLEVCFAESFMLKCVDIVLLEILLKGSCGRGLRFFEKGFEMGSVSS